MERLDTGEFIGFTGLSVAVVGEQPWWRSGGGWRITTGARRFAPEAARAALRFGFEQVVLPDDEIVSFTTTKNLNSQRVMQKLGMRHDPARDFDHPLLPTTGPRSVTCSTWP